MIRLAVRGSKALGGPEDLPGVMTLLVALNSADLVFLYVDRY
jgi:hypothetical protein